jgi:hypothetical protein
MDLTSAQQSGDQFVLTSDDGAVKITKPLSGTVDDDAGDFMVHLAFDGVDTSKSYSLQVIEPDNDPYFLFQGVPYSQLAPDGGGNSGES